MLFHSKRFLIGAVILTLAALITVVIIFWPYQRTAKNQLTRLLESYGLTVSSLTLEKLEGNDALLSDIAIGNPPSLTAQKITAHYSLTEILRGKVQAVDIASLRARVYNKDGRWLVAGLEPLFPHTSTPTTPSLPLSMINLLPEHISLKDSEITIEHPRATVQLPLNLDMTNNGTATATLLSSGITIDAKPYHIKSGIVQVKATLTPIKWHAILSSPNLTITGLDTPIPPLTLYAELSLTPEQLESDIEIRDDSRAYLANLSLSSTAITVRNAHIPWGGGKIALQPVTLPVAMDKPIPLAIDMQNVDLASLLGAISDDKIRGSGKVSGTLPIIYHPDGQITLREGGAHALSDGVISVPPDFLPGDNEQLAIARTTLENFHYTTLQIRVLSEGEEARIQLMLEGSNPDAMEGRPVKLTVNLTGDIMPLIQQSILPVNDLKQLLTIKDTDTL